MTTKRRVENKLTVAEEDAVIVFGEDESIILYLPKSPMEKIAPTQVVLATMIAYICKTENPLVNQLMGAVVVEFNREMEEQRKK